MTDKLSRPRLDYIDAMRGFTILLVIYFHFVIRSMHNPGDDSGVLYVFSRVRMPLFFFVSGFFAYGCYDAALLKKRVKNRLLKQLWPTVAIFLIFSEIYRGGVENTLFDAHKGGYWFTYSLVQTFLVFAVASYAMTAAGASRRTQLVVYAAATIGLFAMGSVAMRFARDFMTGPIGSFLSLTQTISLAPYFFFGAAVRLYYDEFLYVIRNKWCFAAVVLLFALSYLSDSSIVCRLTSFAGIVTVLGVFYYMRDFWSGESRLSTMLITFGKNTLPIYLFHYFIIFSIAAIDLSEGLQSIVGPVYIEFPVLIAVSVLIAWACVGFDRLAGRYAGPVHRFLFP
ncbi:MAG: acyltransferase [Muribaculaceae bacterium]|nr:acyltransferase [Muribaculaceae bacterium]